MTQAVLYAQKPLPIWRDANRLLLHIEQAVSAFPRYHKYAIGTDLRRGAMRVCRLLARAVGAQGAERSGWVQRLLHSLGDLKIMLQLAKELAAFASFSQFQGIVELVVSVSKQGTAWLRKLSAAGKRSESRGLS